MTIRSTFILCLMLWCLGVKAQHCPFDNLAVIVVEVSDSISLKKIYDLELVLRYENGDTAVWAYGNDTLYFCQNAQATSNEWQSINFRKIRYEFAEDNYVLPLSMDLKKEQLYIYIHDNSDTYYDKSVLLRPEDYFDIHKNMGINWYDIRTDVSMPGVDGAFHHLIKISLIPKNQ